MRSKNYVQNFLSEKNTRSSGENSSLANVLNILNISRDLPASYASNSAEWANYLLKIMKTNRSPDRQDHHCYYRYHSTDHRSYLDSSERHRNSCNRTCIKSLSYDPQIFINGKIPTSYAFFQ